MDKACDRVCIGVRRIVTHSQDTEVVVAPTYSKKRERHRVFSGAQPATKAFGIKQATMIKHSAYVVTGSEVLQDGK
jgi:hypothetical protein